MFEKEYDLESLQKITPTGNNFDMYVTPRYIDHFVNHNFEQLTARLIAKQITKDSVFIDIGAHFGFYTLLAGKTSRAKKILAIEPTPKTFEILKRNVELNNLQNVEFYNLAISDRSGEAVFKVAEASDSCGFYEHVNCSIKEEIRVECSTLDAVFSDLNAEDLVIKIDAEGHEVNILDGMQATIARFYPKIKLIVEFNPRMLRQAGRDPGELVDRLFAYGFQVYYVDEASGVVKRIDRNQGERHYKELRGLDEQNGYTNLYCVPVQQATSIVFFSHSAEIAGAEKSLCALVAELCNRGIICIVILPSEGKLKIDLENAGAFTHITPYSWWAGVDRIPSKTQRERLVHDFSRIKRDLLPTLRQINPDIIYSNTAVIPWGATSAFLLNKPHIWAVHEFGLADHGLMFYYPSQLVAAYIEGASNAVIANSRATKEYFFGKAEINQIKIIHPITELNSSTTELNASGSFFFRQDSIRLALIGRMQAGKGQLEAVEAVNELLRMGVNAELVMAGIADFEYLELLNRTIKQNNLQNSIRLLGFLDNPFPLLEQADIVLMCSRNESFGRSTLEAMMCGKPVVASNTGGTPEIVQDGVNGLLYTPGDIRELANKIKLLAEDVELRMRLGQRAAEFAYLQFSKESSVSKFLEIVYSLKQAKNTCSREFINWVVNLEEDYEQFIENEFTSFSNKLQQEIKALKIKSVEDLEAIRLQLTEESAQKARLKQELTELREYANQRELILQNLNATLLDIYSSTAWSIIQKIWRLRLWLAPSNSLREKVGRSLIGGFKKVKKVNRTDLPNDMPAPGVAIAMKKPLNEQRWMVMATQHTLFIGYLVAERLRAHGCSVNIVTSSPSEFSSDYYVVICPQMFQSLPPGEKRIVFQMEQSVSSRWFTADYLKTLNESLAVLDYSLDNIEFLSSKGIVYPQIYYLPIGASLGYGDNLQTSAKKFDILFYGDEKSSPRRLEMLEALRQEFNLKVASEIFGQDMISLIKQAKLVINIHYYENALLEMPRIQECISLGVPVISESSSDQVNYPELNGAVRFFEQDSIESMLETVRLALLDEEVLRKNTSEAAIKGAQRFSFMFDRFLIGMGFLPPAHIKRICLPSISSKTVLSMPETIVRRRTFEKMNIKDFFVFDGLRRSPSWMGCALSYTVLARNALEQGITRLMVMEDDVLLPDDHQYKMSIVQEYLDQNEGEWDIFVGVIAALHPNAKVLKKQIYKGLNFITIDKMTSMVCNVYSKRALQIIADWDPENTDVETNTIDRYLENQHDLKVVVVLPYLVGHREDVHSTLWGFQNTQYKEWFARSQAELEAKVRAYENNNRLDES